MSVTYKDIPQFPGYRVGDDGSVWSSRKPGAGFGLTKEWRKLRIGPDSAGRPSLSLRRDRSTRQIIVAHVVAAAFLGPRPEGLLVCHDNGDQTDNRSTNLKYGTPKDNEADKARHGRKLLGSAHPVAKLTADKVREIKAALALPRRHGLIATLARKYGVDEAIITRIRDGKAWAWVI